MITLQRLLLSGALFLAPVALLASADADATRGSDHSVTVQATAVSKAAPDKLELFLEIRAVRPTMKESQAAVTESRQRLVAALKGAGVPDDALTVFDLEQGRETEWNDRRHVFKGFYAASAARLTLRDFAKLPAVQNEILGDERVAVKGMLRSSDREGELRRSALVAAAEAARKKAEVLAQTLGAQLGRVVMITETTQDAAPYARLMAMNNAVQEPNGDADAVVQEVTVRASITVRFELRP